MVIDGPYRAPLTYRVPRLVPLAPPSGVPVAVSPRNSTTFTAISINVIDGADDGLRTVLTLVRPRAHSGQRMPTDVGVMQSGQIGRPHEEHETPVSCEGCL
jgi:hypothetical protein